VVHRLAEVLGGAVAAKPERAAAWWRPRPCQGPHRATPWLAQSRSNRSCRPPLGGGGGNTHESTSTFAITRKNEPAIPLKGEGARLLQFWQHCRMRKIQASTSFWGGYSHSLEL
jgi:hypothetical protein